MSASHNSLVIHQRGTLADPDKLAIFEQTVLVHLNKQTDAELLETRQRSKYLGKTAWRIECACDAETLSRAVRLKGGRGLTDVSGKGVYAAIRRRANQIGCTPMTVWNNSRIHNLIELTERSKSEFIGLLRLLDEKGYYTAALTAINPEEALVTFAKHKSTLIRFRVSDAYRLLNSTGTTKRQATKIALENVRKSDQQLSQERKQDSEHISHVVTHLLQEIIPRCTSSEILRIHQSYLQELQSYAQEDMFDIDVSTALIKTWYAGNRDEKSMSIATGFPMDIVSREMGMLAEFGTFVRIPSSNGNKHWHKVGEPADSANKKAN